MIKSKQRNLEKARFEGEDGKDKSGGEASDDEDADEDEDMPEINAEDYENDSDLYSDIEV